MSDHIHDGAIDISPALNAVEIKKFNAALLAVAKKAYTNTATKKVHPVVSRLTSLVGSASDFREAMGLGLEVKTTEREEDEGTLLVRTSDRLSYFHSEYSTTLSPLSIVDTLRKTFPSHTLTGVLISVDERNSSAEKVTVHQGQVFGVKGTISVLWEDGSKSTELSSIC